MGWLWILMVLIHLLVSGLVLLGIKIKVLKVYSYMFFVVLFLPVWGLILVLLVHFNIGMNNDKDNQIIVDKMKISSELYKSVTVDEKKIAKTTVPMEEALIINSSKERRKLILDVLNDNPKEYIEFLQKAGDNDDTEVVHYSVTAMVEISKENDEQLHRLECEYKQNPEDRELLEDYTEFLWRCLSQNMMQGQVEQINRGLFSELMNRKMQDGGSVEDFVRVVNNELVRKNYTEAAQALDRMKLLYPQDEQSYLLRIKYYAALKSGREIKEVLNEISEKEIYISTKGKEVIAFWKE